MKELEIAYKNSGKLHHAYFLVGEREFVIPEVVAFFEHILDVKTLGNPDFLKLDFSTLTIDDARFISDTQSRKPIYTKVRPSYLELNFQVKKSF